MTTPFDKFLPVLFNGDYYLQHRAPIKMGFKISINDILAEFNDDGKKRRNSRIISCYAKNFSNQGSTYKKNHPILTVNDLKDLIVLKPQTSTKVVKKRTPTFFQGLIGEKIMKVYLDMLFHYLKQKYEAKEEDNKPKKKDKSELEDKLKQEDESKKEKGPSLNYDFFNGKRWEIIKTSHIKDNIYYALAYGAHQNVKIYTIESDTLPVGLVTQYDNKETKCEIDVLVNVQFQSNQLGTDLTKMLIVGEAKTGKTKKSFSHGSSRYPSFKNRVLKPLQKLYSDHKILLAYSAPEIELVEEKILMPSAVKMFEYFRSNGIDCLFVPLKQGRKELNKLTNHAFQEYERLLGKRKFKNGEVLYNDDIVLIFDEAGKVSSVFHKIGKNYIGLNR